jgi:Tfp pilus assembly major pilin PilA
MYCPKCGTQNVDNAYKCTNCGIILQRVAPEKKSNTAVIVTVIVVAGVFVFFAVVGILAAIAIPAYLDYTVKARISEVTDAFDGLVGAAVGYHAKTGQFPDSEYPLDTLVAMSQTYGTFSCTERGSDNDITYRFTFNNMISSSIDGCTLDIQLTYAPDTGYTTQWLSTSTLPLRYMPRR